MDGELIAKRGRLGDLGALANVARQSAAGAAKGTPESVAANRQLLAEFCKLLAKRAGRAGAESGPVTTTGSQLASKGTPSKANGTPITSGPIEARLSPRLKQTLEHLLRGDGEKQIAYKLGLSRHTVHVYVKSLHKRYGVSSRAELLARFIHGNDHA